MSERRKKSINPLFVILCMAFISVGWIWLVASTKLQEMIVGACSLLLSIAFLAMVHQSSDQRLDFRARDLAQGWRIPWYVVTGVWEITVVLVRDIVTSNRAGSYFRACRFEIREGDSRLQARGVLATAYTTTAPNFIVVGVDPARCLLLFHQIERSSVPRMTQALGAKP